MKPDWYTRVGDSEELHVTLCNAEGEVVDLDGYIVWLQLWGPRTVTSTCRVTDSRKGQVVCVPRFVVAGQYRGRVQLLSTTGVEVSYPTNRDFLVTVLANG